MNGNGVDNTLQVFSHVLVLVEENLKGRDCISVIPHADPKGSSVETVDHGHKHCKQHTRTH
jgi:hypothetical protein